MSNMNIGGLGPASGPSFEPKKEGPQKDSLETWCAKKFDSLSDSLSLSSVSQGPAISYTKETVASAKAALLGQRPVSEPSKERAMSNLQRLAASQSEGAPNILKTSSSTLLLNTTIAGALAQFGSGEPVTGETINPLEGLQNGRKDDEDLSENAKKI